MNLSKKAWKKSVILILRESQMFFNYFLLYFYFIRLFYFIPKYLILTFIEPDEFIYRRWQIAMLIYQDQIKDIYGRIRIS